MLGNSMRRAYRFAESVLRIYGSPIEQKIGWKMQVINAPKQPYGATNGLLREELRVYSRYRCMCTSVGSEAMNVEPEGGIVEVPLAQTGEGIADCELLRWFVQEGDFVEEFQPLCEVQSDKATIEITSRYKGKVSKVNFMPGAIVKVGETLLEMMTDGAAMRTASSEACKEDSSSKVLATPAVRSLAKQLGINLADVKGTGKDGRIMKEDLLKLASVKEGLEEDISGFSPPTPKETESIHSNNSIPCFEEKERHKSSNLDEPKGDGFATVRNLKLDTVSSEDIERTHEDKVIPVRGFRRTMVKTMTAAAAVPHFHYMEEIRMDSLVELKTALQSRTGTKLTYLSFLIKALSLSLQSYPILNSNVSPDASEIICKAWHNIGVAMATSSGLAVPTIKQVQKLSVQEIAEEICRLSKLAGDNKLSPQDVSDGTITISNFGAIGGIFGSPVLNLPQAAILAVGRIQKLPRFDAHGNVCPASIMSVTWGADHRVIDGATIANFCNKWKDMVEHPEQWLLHLK